MGERTDVAGENWVFNAGGLKPATTYELQLFKDPPWPLRTLPHPEENVSRFRLMVYTCAGGHDGVTADGKPYWVSIANRRRLLAAGLAQKPDAVLAIGDQVYCLRSAARRARRRGCLSGRGAGGRLPHVRSR
jgi:hypothetical protein